MLALLALVVTLSLVSPAAAATLREAPDPGVRTDGRVSDVLRVGDRVYLAGTFTHVNGKSRTRLAAVSAGTGRLLPWAPRANGWVKTLESSGNGTKIYAGGSFTKINGSVRGRLAAVSAASGTVDDRFDPRSDGTVNDIVRAHGRLYVGGTFSKVGGEHRKRLAALHAGTGEALDRWRPSAAGEVRTLGLSPDGRRLYAGGHFRRISSKNRGYLAALSPSSGAVLRWNPNPGRPVLDLVAGSGSVFTAESGRGGRLASYGAAGGRLWNLGGDGDVQTVTLMRGTVYAGGHFRTLGNRPRGYFAAADARRGKLLPGWTPTARGGGAWVLTPDPSRGRLYAGGDFTTINGKESRRFARFSR